MYYQREKEPSLWSLIKNDLGIQSLFEPAATFASSAVALPASGVSALPALPLGGVDAFVDVQKHVQDKLTYTPKTAGGQAGLEGAVERISPVANKIESGLQWLGNSAADALPENAPTWAKGTAYALGYTSPDILGAALGWPAASRVARTTSRSLGLPDIGDVSKFKRPGFGEQFGGISMKAPKKPRRSAAETEALGLKHPVGLGKNLKEPVHEVNVSKNMYGFDVPYKPVNIEKMQGGEIISLGGDRSWAGGDLTGINGIEFNYPVPMQGGFQYPQINDGRVWASARGNAVGINNRAISALESGRTPYGVYTPMGHKSMNHNTFMADAMLEQMQHMPISQTTKNKFDIAMRKAKNVGKRWKGIDDPSSLELLNTNGEVRKEFLRLAQLDEFQSKGFPDATRTRIAVTHPDLMDTPDGHGGQMWAELSGELDYNGKHSTYDTDLLGTYMGGNMEGWPRELLFRDFYNRRRGLGAEPQYDARSFEMSNPTQIADQQWVDDLMSWQEGLNPPMQEGYALRGVTGNHVNLTTEAVPAQNERHFGNLANMGEDARQRYSRDFNWLDSNGTDVVAQAAGLQPVPSRYGTGIFEPQGATQPQFNPLVVGQVPVKGLDEAEGLRDRLNGIVSFEGAFDNQHGSTWNFYQPNNSGSSLRIDTAGLPRGEIEKLWRHFENNGAAFVDNGDGSHSVIDFAGRTPKQLDAEIMETVRPIVGNRKIQRGETISDYVDREPLMASGENGAITMQMLDNIDKVDGLWDEIVGSDKVLDKLAGRRSKEKDFLKDFPDAGGVDPRIENLRKFILKARLKGKTPEMVKEALRTAIRTGKIPAGFAAGIAPSVGFPSEEEAAGR